MSLILEKRGDLEYFIPENIKIPAIFTVKLNFAFKKDYDTIENVEKNYRTIADSLGFSVNNIIYAGQKHTDNILVCDKNFWGKRPKNMLPLPDDYIYDATVTNMPGVLLSVRTADCAPILFYDEEHNAVGTAHCGWKRTMKKLQIKTILKMRELYNTDLSKLKAAIGPCISKCCYEVSPDFYENFTHNLGLWVNEYFQEKSDGKYMCDLKGINNRLLCDLLNEENIEISQNCTCCEEDLFFSHRWQGEHRGTHAAFIGVRE